MDRRASKCFKFQHYETDLTGALYDHHRRQKLQLFLVIQVNIHSHLQITLAHRKGLSVATVWYRPGSLPAQGCSLVHCRPTLCYELWLLYCCLDLQCKSTPSSLTSVDLPATLACTANKSFFFFFLNFQIERIAVDLRERNHLEPRAGKHSVNIFTYATVPKEREESSLMRLNSAFSKQGSDQ